MLDRRETLARIKTLEENSADAIRRLEQRADVLERDVRPAHDGSRLLFAAHSNLSLTISYVGEVHERVKAMVRLHDQLAGEIGDWDRLMVGTIDVTDSILHFRSQPALADNEVLLPTFLEVRAGALDVLEGEYSRLLHDLHDMRAHSPEHPDPGSIIAGAPASMLMRLRRTMSAAKSDTAATLFVRISSEQMQASADAMRRSFAVETPETAAHPLVRAPGAIVTIAQFERVLCRAVLDGFDADNGDLPGELLAETSSDHREALQEVFASGMPALLATVERGVACRVEDVVARTSRVEKVCATAMLLMALYEQATEARGGFQAAVEGTRPRGWAWDSPGAPEAGGALPAHGDFGLGNVARAAAEGATRCLELLPQAVRRCHAQNVDSGPARPRASTRPGSGTQAESRGHGGDGIARAVGELSLVLVGDRERYTALEREGVGARPMQELLREVWESLDARIRDEASAEKDARRAAVHLLSCYTTLVQSLGPAAPACPSPLAVVMGDAGVAVRRQAELQAQALVSAVWVPALQAISSVHVASSKTAAQAALDRSERHAIKNALTTFNHQVELVLADGGLRVAAHIRPALVEASVDFVLPPYSDFLRKFGGLPFSGHKGRYLLFTAEKLRSALRKHLFGGLGTETPLATPLTTPR